MSKPTITTRVRPAVKEAVQEYAAANGIDTDSTAVKRLMEQSLVSGGYLTGGPTVTPARQLAREIAKLLFYVAATFWVLGFLQSPTYFAPALTVGAGCAVVAAIGRWVVPRLEPGLTKRLPQVEVTKRGAR